MKIILVIALMLIFNNASAIEHPFDSSSFKRSNHTLYEYKQLRRMLYFGKIDGVAFWYSITPSGGDDPYPTYVMAFIGMDSCASCLVTFIGDIDCLGGHIQSKVMLVHDNALPIIVKRLEFSPVAFEPMSVPWKACLEFERSGYQRVPAEPNY